MKQLRQIISLSVAGIMIAGALSACSTEAGAPSPAPGDVAFQTAGVSRDTTLFTVDGVAVPAEEYLFFLSSSIAEQIQRGNLARDAAWETEIDGVPAAQFVMDDAKSTVLLFRVVRNKAAEEGVTLSETDLADIDSQMAKTEQTINSRGLTLQQGLDEQCISEEGFRNLSSVYYLLDHLMEKYKQPGGILEPTDEGMDALLEEFGYYKVKHILLSTVHDDGTSYSDEEKAAVKQEAEALEEQLRNAEDPIALFDQLMGERSDDPGSAAYPDGYLSYPGQMVPSFEEAAKALEVGQISDPVESDFGYHIILRLDADTPETRSYYPQYRMDKLMDEWVTAAKVEMADAYNSINPEDFYQKQQALIEEIEAAASLPSTSTSPAPEGTPVPTAAAS